MLRQAASILLATFVLPISAHAQVPEQLLTQVRNDLAYIRSATHWGEICEKEGAECAVEMECKSPHDADGLVKISVLRRFIGIHNELTGVTYIAMHSGRQPFDGGQNTLQEFDQAGKALPYVAEMLSLFVEHLQFARICAEAKEPELRKELDRKEST